MKNPHIPNAVRLWHVMRAGLIVSFPTGVWYENQVGGHSCSQESIEGFYVPLADAHLYKTDPILDMVASAVRVDQRGTRWIDLQDALARIILGKYGGECFRGINLETANKIDALLHLDSAALQAGLSVDRTKLDKCQEAWIFVTGKNINEIDGFVGAFEGILTWFNSD